MRNIFAPGYEMPKLMVATRNEGKITEFRRLFAHLPGLELVVPADLGLDIEVEESGSTYAENAALKAVALAAASRLPALGDDSGIEIAALNGEPGLHSARIAPTAAERRAIVLRRLAGKPRPWHASFHSTLCLALPSGEQYLAEGVCLGEISPEERGPGGFGYDPHLPYTRRHAHYGGVGV
jgi:XTP/dITP diphosphohydrolase